ncbi:phosphotransferase [Actinophytocola algeriensis]|uniref:Spectinomycin phosphotransferase/16S rRNA (Guanine(1405)-N(7))-methyltransferase n=1 Tax=Actinophytocola algeriensis TaxID=1768010 RepID=A0A7W7Q517_9PSEU|nr:phosphotransferase [Actinophytocola algeriensis]MBB4907119.1 spectinomycin phosphotransferase/16S rRNA (guanine(1405)-N(7))-methyltransferase [Actinophytocola algeriensis]MBE1478602.1 spectinomycin phosphotransferase/16S rRNA (guanine(1405)-N(7))-methyltransferase [Actinophytocola algeriensis]
MLSPPSGFTSSDLVAALAAWGVDGPVQYQPVGFGSHHWTAGDHFVTVDEDPDFRQLEASLRSAADVPVAVAPLFTRDGEPLVRAGRFAVTVYPFVAGESFEWGEFRDAAHLRAALDLVLAVHRTPARHALTDDCTVALPPIPMDEGPYSRPAAALLTSHASAIAWAHTRLWELAARVDRSRMVLTHGEPHPGNTMLTADGWRLIDWDTAKIAPPERDLWHLATPETLAAYEEATGVRPEPDLLAMYRLHWDLTDLTEFAAGFARPHDGSADDDESWRLLQDLLAGLAPGPR